MVYVLKWFMKRKGVDFEDIPSFIGPWPDFNNEGGLLSIGTSCSFRSFRLRHRITVKKNGELRFGNNLYLNDGVCICASQSIRIGDYTKIGDMTSIYDTNFHQILPDEPPRQAPVIIGKNVWIGANSMILAGSTIGDHTVIAAGSIVTGEIPAKSLAAGSPAIVVKTINVPDNWVRK